jgi:hypothetical protein
MSFLHCFEVPQKFVWVVGVEGNFSVSFDFGQAER